MTAPTSSSEADKTFSRGRPSYWWRAGQERRLEWVREFVELSGKRLLDAGCGVGTYTHVLQRAGAIALGVDVEEARVAKAKGEPSSATFVVASVEQLPCRAGSFDLVFSHEVIEHLQDDQQALREAARVLRPGGHLVLYAPNRGFPFETHGIVWRGRYRFGNIPLVNWLPNPLRHRLAPHARAYRGRELARLVESAGLEVRHHTQVFPGFDRLESAHPRLGQCLRQLARLLERTPLRVLGISHFLVARKTEPLNHRN